MVVTWAWKSSSKRTGSTTSLFAMKAQRGLTICDRRFGKDAAVDYLGTESPHYLENDGLYFIIRPPTKKGTPRKRGGTHVVVYVQ